MTGMIIANPSAALAQDEELTSSNAWVTDQVQAPAAWETTRGEGVTVAVVDTGIGLHPFFDDKDVQDGHSVLPSDDDTTGWHDTQGHGTHVAASVLHVAPEATILPVRIETGGDTENFDIGVGKTILEGIRWAADNGADVIVLPWGEFGGDPDEAFLETIQYAIDKGVLVVASAGNDPNVDVPAPASMPGVVAVTGTDKSGGAWYGNSTGPETVIAAPADEMLHPKPQVQLLGEPELYEEALGGTSNASGIVGGVAALTMAAHTDLDANNVIQRLIQTAGDGRGSNRSENLGFGLINADAAVHTEGIEAVDENPLGYPMGEAGASGASPEGEEEEADQGPGEEPGAAEVSEAAGEPSESGLSTVIVIAAAIVLVGAAIAVWLVLRGRGRKEAAAGGQPTAFGAEGGRGQGGYVPAASNQQHYSPPPAGPQGYGGPPAGGQQNYGPPIGGGEPNPPWGPNDQSRR